MKTKKIQLKLTLGTIRTLTENASANAPHTTGYPTSCCRISDERLKQDIRPL